MDWSGVNYLWIIAVCALILTAPIHFPWKKHTNLHRGWSNNEYILSILASFILKSYKTSIMSSTNVQHLGLNWQSIMLTISWNLDKNLKFTLFITSSNIRMSKITFIYIYIYIHSDPSPPVRFNPNLSAISQNFKHFEHQPAHKNIYLSNPGQFLANVNIFGMCLKSLLRDALTGL